VKKGVGSIKPVSEYRLKREKKVEGEGPFKKKEKTSRNSSKTLHSSPRWGGGKKRAGGIKTLPKKRETTKPRKEGCLVVAPERPRIVAHVVDLAGRGREV